MTAPAAFSATYSDFKLVRTRKVVQLVFEIPIEQSGAALDALGGMPNPAAEVWCAIARLSSGAEPVNPVADSAASAATQKGDARNECSPDPIPHEPRQDSGSGGVKRKWDELPYAQQAAIRCNELEFIDYICDRFGTADSVASIVREYCGISSRRDIVPGTLAGDKWAQLDSDYQLWRAGART